MKFSGGIFLLLIVLLGLIARLVLVVYVVGIDRVPAGDEIDYHALASNLADGSGYRLADGQLTARRPPLYPFAISILYRFFGANPAVARLFQVLLGTMIVWLTFLLTKRLFAPRVAWIAVVLVAVNPFLIFISGYLLTENLYIVLLLLVLLAVPTLSGATANLGRTVSGATTHLSRAVFGTTTNLRRAVSGGKTDLGQTVSDALTNLRKNDAWEWWCVILAGLLLGLCSLARPTAVVLALWIVFFALFLGKGTMGRRVVGGIAVFLLMGLVMLPWGARNKTVYGEWLFSTTHGGVTFYQGNNEAVLEYPQYHGGVAPLYMLPGYETLEKKPELEKDEEARALGKRFLNENKRSIPVLVWRKLVRFWRIQSDAGMSGVKSGWWFDKDSMLGRLASSLDIGFVYAVLAIPLFAVGLILSLRDWRRFVYLYGLVVIHTAVTMAFHGSIRMRVPIEPVIAIFAAYTLHLFIERIRPRHEAD